MLTGLLQTPIKKFKRFVLTRSVFFLPKARQLQIERIHRGKEQFRKLRRADYVMASYGNSGRTWFRVMLSRYYTRKYTLDTSALINFDNYQRKNVEIPKIFLTHDNFIKDYTGHADSKADFYGHKTILLVRHPADVSVSQYFQWQHRMKDHKVDLNSFPPRGTQMSVFEFVLREQSGIPKIMDFLNVWAQDMANLDHFLLIRYEDLRADPEAELSSVLEFLGEAATRNDVADAVAWGSIDNMRQIEQNTGGLFSGGRLKARDKGNPDSFKVRRAKVGGFRDYFSNSETAEIEQLINAKLAPVFGYHTRSDTPP